MRGELSNGEVQETKPSEAENYKNIKPETMTDRGAKDYWKSEFQSASDSYKSETVEKRKTDIDDNGEKFRDGNKLLPNIKYEVNGYNYETDGNGRIISAEGKLRLRDPDYKLNIEKVRKYEGQEYKENDQHGHLIGHQFGGSDKLENLVPMNSELNLIDYKKTEMTLANAVKDGADVHLRVEPVYEGNSNRPSEFRVSYSIDGDKEVTVFKNKQ